MHQKENITARCVGEKISKVAARHHSLLRGTELRSMPGRPRSRGRMLEPSRLSPPEPACSLCSPSRKKAPRLLLASALPETPPVQARLRPGWVLGAAGLASPLLRTPTWCQGWERGNQAWLFPRPPPLGVSLTLLLAKGSQHFTMGLTPDSFCTRFSTATCPHGSLRGFPSGPLIPTRPLAGRG